MNEIQLEENSTAEVSNYSRPGEISHYVKDIMARIDVYPVSDAMYLLHKINSGSILISLMYSDDNGQHEIVINQFEASIAGDCIYTRGRISLYSQGQIHNVQLVLNKPPKHLEISLEDINICPIH